MDFRLGTAPEELAEDLPDGTPGRHNDRLIVVTGLTRQGFDGFGYAFDCFSVNVVVVPAAIHKTGKRQLRVFVQTAFFVEDDCGNGNTTVPDTAPGTDYLAVNRDQPFTIDRQSTGKNLVHYLCRTG